MKLFYCDLETTGTDHNIHAIHRMAYIIDCGNEEGETGTLFIKPHDGAVLDPDALEKCSVTPESIFGEKYMSTKEAYTSLIDTLSKYVDKYNRLDKLHFVGYNSNFDNAFLRKFFERNGDTYFGSWFYWPPIDIMGLAAEALMDKRNDFKNFQLSTLCDHFGIQIQAHDALSDILATKALYGKLRTANWIFPK